MRQRLISACTHTEVRTADPLPATGGLNSCYPSPGLVLKIVDGPRGRQRKLRKSSRKRLKAPYALLELGVWRLSKPRS